MYGARYISDRFLPDKAIDLVDEAASALRLAQESKPDQLEALDREIVRMQIELESLKKESDVFSVERREKIQKDLQGTREKAETLTGIWQAGAFTPAATTRIREAYFVPNPPQNEPAWIVSKTQNSAWKMLSTSLR